MRFWWQVILCLCFYCVVCKNEIPNYRYKPRHLSDTIMYYTERKTPTVYLKIYVDYPLMEQLQGSYHNDTKEFRRGFKNVTKQIVQDAETMFAHPSLSQKIRVVLLTTKFLRKNKFMTTENASHYLRKFCEWQVRKKVQSDRWYYSVMLTGLDIYVKTATGLDRTSTGRGYIRSMCNPTRSCTLLEWHPKNVPYLLAHEIAHRYHASLPNCSKDKKGYDVLQASMAVNHDGPPNNPCKYRGYVMSQRYNSGTHPKVWSPCSRMELRQYLKSKKSRCLYQ